MLFPWKKTQKAFVIPLWICRSALGANYVKKHAPANLAMSNKKKSILNLVTSVLSQVVILTLGLILPRLILKEYGSDANGFASTVTQIFTYMALLEAGISISARNALYKPIKDNNKAEISFYVSAAKRYYKRVSLIYCISIISLSFILPLVLKTEISYWTVFAYTLFEGLASVMLFFFVNTWTCFLVAKGDSYIVNSINMLSKTIIFLIKIVLVLLGCNLALVQSALLIASFGQVGLYFLLMKRKYGWIDYHLAPKDYKLPDRGAYVLTEIAWTIFSSTDMIILSIIVSTKAASVYSVYNMVFLALNSILNSIYSSLSYHLGQTYSDDIEKYKRVHNLFNSLFVSGTTVLMCTAFCTITPFVKLYTSGVNDTEYIYSYLPLLFCLVQLLSWSRYVPGNLSGIAGYARITSFFSLGEALLNIILSVILVHFLGITGVILATVVSLPIKVVFLNVLSEKIILKRSPLKTVLILSSNYSLFLFAILINHFFQADINSYWGLVFFGIVYLISFASVDFLIQSIINKDLFLLFKMFKIKKN